MSEGITPEKVSRNPQTQSRVEEAEKKFSVDNTIARRLVARELIAERNRERLKTTTEMSLTDALTGLPNLRSYEQRLKEEIARMKRGKIKGAMMKLDVNNLKIVNDRNAGHHEEGNNLLRGVAEVIRIGVRIEDFAARTGGDEFDILFPGATPEQVEIIWNTRLLPAFKARGISIGAGVADIDLDNVDKSKKEADAALYRAKRITKIGIKKGQPTSRSKLVLSKQLERAA